MSGLIHLFRAAETLGNGRAPFQERFLPALEEFWAAAFEIDDWPPNLMDQVDRTIDQVLALHLSARPNPAEIDAEMARQIAEEIVRLANELSDGTLYILRID